MKLYHISEESQIQRFIPRIPKRTDISQKEGLVWAVEERCLPNYLTPRECPRVTYYAGDSTTAEDRKRYFSSPLMTHAVILEHQWYRKIRQTTLYRYEFHPASFKLLDETAGYYVSRYPQIPMDVKEIPDILEELISYGVEIRFIDNLWPLCDEIRQSTLNWSMIKMKLAGNDPAY